MSGNPSTQPPSGARVPLAHPAVAAMYRPDDEIRRLLQGISDEPPGDAGRRRQVIDILDDLAEELIGRTHHGDRALKEHIRAMRELVGRVPPTVERT